MKIYSVSALVLVLLPVVIKEEIQAENMKEAIKIFKENNEGYEMKYIRGNYNGSGYVWRGDYMKAPKRVYKKRR